MFEPAGTETQQRQSIVDELERLDERKREILAAVCGEIEEKHADLIRSCSLLGHVYGRPLADGRRVCVFCRAGVLVFPALDLPASAGDESNDFNRGEEESATGDAQHSLCPFSGPAGPFAPISQLSNEGRCVQCTSTIAGSALCHRE